jgi:hypothetical protein
MQTKDIIKKYRTKENPQSMTWDMLMESANQILAQKMKLVESEIDNKLKTLLVEIDNYTEQLKRQADETLKKHIESRKIEIKGKDGKDYILTNQDKEQIASSIKVPVVKQIIEKREIIKEQPIIKETIKNIENKDTAQQIIDKVNSIKENIFISSINGLQNELNFLKKAIREKRGGGSSGGGGMGNTQHESKELTTLTAAVMTSYPISANGYAIWIYYQGQALTRGTGYSIGNDRKTINLLFTPVEGTYLDIIYIR